MQKKILPSFVKKIPQNNEKFKKSTFDEHNYFSAKSTPRLLQQRNFLKTGFTT